MTSRAPPFAAPDFGAHHARAADRDRTDHFASNTDLGAGAFGWIVLEFLGTPVRAFRDQVRAQLLLLTNVGSPKPRETISTSLEIQQYDVALKAGREAQRILREMGSQMLAFSESEIAA